MQDPLTDPFRAWAKSAIAVAFALTLVAYYGALSSGFKPVDEAVVLAHPLITGARTGGSPARGLWYRPVRTASYALDHTVWEHNPAGYHLSSALYHGATGVMAFAVACRLGVPPAAGLAGLALFIVHPIATASVVPIAARGDVLSTLFWLAAFWLYLGWRAQPGRIRAGLTIAAGLWALAAKESAFTLPLVFIAHALILERDPAARRRALAFASLAAGVVFLATVEARRLAPPGVIDQESLTTGAPGTAARAFLLYLRLFAWPDRLSEDYSQAVLPASEGLFETAGLTALAALAAYAFAAWVLARRWPAVGFGLAAYGLAMVPALAFALTPERAAEHYLYLPAAIALFGLAALAQHALAFRPWLAPAVGVVIGLTLTARTVIRVQDHADTMTLIAATVRDRPECARAHTNLGVQLEGLGRRGEAEGEYRQALAILPDDRVTLNNLGTLLMQRGAMDEAAEKLSRAVAIPPGDYVEALNNLGAVECERGHLTEAEAHIRAALALLPEYPSGLLNLGMTLRRQKRFDEAERAYKSAIGLDSTLTGAYNNLGALYLDRGRYADAVAAFNRAIELEPTVGRWHVNLARALSSSGSADAARAALIRASSVEPDSGTVLLECARLAHDLKLLQLSRDFLERATRLGSPDPALKARLDAP